MVYRISEPSIRRALDTGRTASELHALFARHSKTPVPQGLTYLIDDVARRHGQLRVGMAASFVRCEDPALLAQAIAAPALPSSWTSALLAPTVAVSQAPIAEVLAALRTAGFAPAAEDSSGTIVDIRVRGARVPAPRPPPRLPAAAGPDGSDAGRDRRGAAQGGGRAVRRDRAWTRPRRWRSCSSAAHRQDVGGDRLRRRGGGRDPARRRADQRPRRPADRLRSGRRAGAGVRDPPRDVGRVGRPGIMGGMTEQRKWTRMTDGPLIVQSDKTVLLEVDHELAGAARAAIAPFAELERAPEHIHTYRITPLALWNARAAGHDAEQVVDALVSASRATRCRSRCWSTSSTRWPATAGCSW